MLANFLIFGEYWGSMCLLQVDLNRLLDGPSARQEIVNGNEIHLLDKILEFGPESLPNHLCAAKRPPFPPRTTSKVMVNSCFSLTIFPRQITCDYNFQWSYFKSPTSRLCLRLCLLLTVGSIILLLLLVFTCRVNGLCLICPTSCPVNRPAIIPDACPIYSTGHWANGPKWRGVTHEENLRIEKSYR